jgi:hypothetical protein
MIKWKQVGIEAQALGIDNLVESEQIGNLAAIITGYNMKDPTTKAMVMLMEKASSQFNDSMEDILHFYSRSWFRRMWIVQEVAVAKEVAIQCGYVTTDMDVLRWGLSICQISFTLPLPGTTTKDHLSTLSKAQGMNEPLAHLVSCRHGYQRAKELGNPERKGGRLSDYLHFLNVSCPMEATEDRDRIFGILALSRDVGDLGIKPDYGSTVEHVYTKTAKAIFNHGNGMKGPTLELLGLCRSLGDGVSNSLPSWVPDWRRSLRASFCETNRQSVDPCFGAGGKKGTNPIIIQGHVLGDNVLGLRGYIIDQVEEVGSPWEGLPPTSDLLKPNLWAEDRKEDLVKELRRRFQRPLTLIRQIEKLCDKAIARYSQHGSSTDEIERLKDAFWRVPCGDLAIATKERFSVRATNDWKESYYALVESCEYMNNEDVSIYTDYWAPLFASRTEDEQKKRLESGQTYQKKITDMRDMRPFLTKLGYVGMAPASAKEGDVVVVFIGAQVPFMLRKVDHEKYTLLGEAYCHLIMDGEVLSQQRPVADIFLM